MLTLALVALFARVHSQCATDGDCTQFGFKCDGDNAMCYPACSLDEDCNAIWGYAGATCNLDGDFGYCSPLNLVPDVSECDVDAECPVDGFSCFTGGDAFSIPNFCYPACSSQADCDTNIGAGALAGYSCVNVDYVAFNASICTASPTNYACDIDADCAGDLKCLGSGPASLCYVGCDVDDDCSPGYECVSDAFGFNACRPADLDISCNSTMPCSAALDGFACVAGACAPVCTEGDDAACEALTGTGSVCVTMDDGTGQKLSICDDSALSTGITTTTTTTTSSAPVACATDGDCTQFGFKCDLTGDAPLCYPACSSDEDCNAIWGYAGATCDLSGDFGYCSPANLLQSESECDVDDDCLVDGFSCFTGGDAFSIPNFCYPACDSQTDCDTNIGAGALAAYSCVNVDYVAFAADICTASPTNYACDTDDDCAGDLKCFGGGPASLCYVGCESNDDCSPGYVCGTDAFGFDACRPSGLNVTCDADSNPCTGVLAGFACVAGACTPACTEGDDAGCEALTGAGSVCLTMDDGTGQKLSICDDSAYSTGITTTTTTTSSAPDTTMDGDCAADSDCPQYGFKCDVDNAMCYPACSTDEDCNSIWGYEGAECDVTGDVSNCLPSALVPAESACDVDDDCPVDGFSCFTGGDALSIPNFCYPACDSQADCDTNIGAGALAGYSCVNVDYVAFAADICTASPSNYACDTDDDCDGDLKCFGSGPASLCYDGCDSDDDCSTGGDLEYECATDGDAFGFKACRPKDVDISCTTECVGALAGFTCVGGACAPVCTEGNNTACEALTGAGSVCLTMDDGTGQKLSVCDDSAVSKEPASGSSVAPMATFFAFVAVSMSLIQQ